MSEWQPIATAPKDRLILTASDFGIHVLEWYEGDDDPDRWWDASGWAFPYGERDGGTIYAEPTHWMPLPGPPA